MSIDNKTITQKITYKILKSLKILALFVGKFKKANFQKKSVKKT